MAIEVVLLGTGNPLPDSVRAGAATLVRVDGRSILVDAGRGVCMRLVAAGVLPPMLDSVLLTHLHSDHICDLNDVVTTQWVMSPVPKAFRLFGPPRTQEVVAGMRAMLQPDIEYRLAHHDDLNWEPQLDVTEVEPGIVLDEDGLRVTGRAPTTGRSNRRSDTGSSTAANPWCWRATPCPARDSTNCVAAPTSMCRRCCGTIS